jgi:hypothetical protein
MVTSELARFFFAGKLTISLFLILLVSTLFPLSTMALVDPQGEAYALPLTNGDILAMAKAKLDDDVIIAKINSSKCHFDTVPTVLSELKYRGVSNAVLLAMIQAPYGAPNRMPAPNNHASSATPERITETKQMIVKVPDGTEVEVQLKNNLSGQDAKVGDLVDFTVLRAVQLNGAVIFAAGASGRGRVTTAKGSGHWGKAGKIEWAMQDVQAVDGSRVPARFTKRSVGDSSGGTVAVAAVATTVLLGPLGLLWGLKKGKAAVIPAGNRYSVFVQGDSEVTAAVKLDTLSAER